MARYSRRALQAARAVPGGWSLENVANLDKLPPSGATLVVRLAKPNDATGGPVRLIALV
jgi:kynurenine formamidase